MDFLYSSFVCMRAKLLQLCLSCYDPTDCSPPDFSTCSPPGDLLDPGIKSGPLTSPVLEAGSLPLVSPGKPLTLYQEP